MSFTEFLLNIFAALLMGTAIGLERQFRQHPAGLRTNALVCIGAALFVTLSKIASADSNPTRIAAQVVSGIGFLGGGVILREGLTVKGMNTAATLWCTAAVGTLAGSGFAQYGLVGTGLIVGVHLAYRPIDRIVDTHLRMAIQVETFYRMRLICGERQEGVVRAILARHVGSQPRMMIQRISVEDIERPDQVEILADIFSSERNDRAMQELMTRINIEPSVTSVSWEKSRGEES